MQKLITKMQQDETLARLKVQTVALKAVHDYMEEHDVVQLMPVMLSTVTDPLCHSVYDARITYLDQELSLTKSMLLHKQAAFVAQGLQKLYIVSPNVRLEKAECKDSGRHLIEFSQVDMELKRATKQEFQRFMEAPLVHVIKTVKERCKPELALFKRDLKVPATPFRVYESKELAAKYGPDYEVIMSKQATEPFWIQDLKREFYDREDPVKKGYYHNYDLIWPEGFGEALSGGERDWEYEVLLRKIKERGQDPKHFASYLELAKQGLLVPTAGGGFGVERLVRFLTGTQHIGDVALFPRVPGETVLI
jgi:asparaginyl-tRNA synthetase